jgi:hypothetical protein
MRSFKDEAGERVAILVFPTSRAYDRAQWRPQKSDEEDKSEFSAQKSGGTRKQSTGQDGQYRNEENHSADLKTLSAVESRLVAEAISMRD